MSDKGTIDYQGMRGDFQDIANNQYPQLQLLQLPLSAQPGGSFSVPLLAAGNNLLLTYEALSPTGDYLVSAPTAGSIDTSAPAPLPQGFMRVNGQGPYIPLSMFGPLMKGLVTPNPNYDDNPIVGGGYSGLQMPIQQLDWIVQPGQQQEGYLLAFFGLNFGMTTSIGNGQGSTYAIPSAAGPLARLEKLFCGMSK